jgi:beta-glucosidase
MKAMNFPSRRTGNPNPNPELLLFKDPHQSITARVNDLIARMTLAEKVLQMQTDAPAIERLGIPAYRWRNDCLYGSDRAGSVTVFPQSIGLAATWNPDLILRTAEAISEETRARHHEALRTGDRGGDNGLTFWAPDVNIFHDPRWGRGQETYGEDPFLAARMGVAFVKGLQDNAGQSVKVVATLKYFPVHSEPDADPGTFDPTVSERDLRTSYLPAFEACVKEGRAAAMLVARNRVNGDACSASTRFLEGILRNEWGFKGFVVSDCGAISTLYRGQQACRTVEEAAVMALRAGVDLSCDCAFSALAEAVYLGLVGEEEINEALARLLFVRFQLGMFDPDPLAPSASIPTQVCHSAEHRALAREAACQSMVLLKNEDGLLPLPKTLRSIAVIGPGADDGWVLLGGAGGVSSGEVTPLAAVRAALPEADVEYARGCGLTGSDESGFGTALEAARGAEVVLFVGGLPPAAERNRNEPETTPGLETLPGGDRMDLNLPGVQEKLLRLLFSEVRGQGKPVILVLLNGSALAVGWAKDNLPAILEAWYPGEEGGMALADVLFGDVSPSGRLPVTFYKSAGDLPPFDDYSMEGRTYRYYRGEPLYPFGYGLSYTRFQYQKLALTPQRMAPRGSLMVAVEVKNVGERTGEEVVQLYASPLTPNPFFPIRQLCGFQRVCLEPGEAKTVVLRLKSESLMVVDDQDRYTVLPGRYRVQIGGYQPGPENLMPPGGELLDAEFEVC